MKIIFFITLTLTCSLVYGQKRTFIEYNNQNESFKFFKIKKNSDTVQIKKPYSYKGVPTTVIVKGLNPFSYVVEFEITHSDVKPINGEQNISEITKSLSMGNEAFGKAVGEIKSSDEFKTLFTNGEFQGLDGIKNLIGFGMADNEFKSEMEVLSSKGDVLVEYQSDLKKQSLGLKSTFQKLVLCDFVNEQLLKLQKDEGISIIEMRIRAKNLIGEILEEPTLEAVINNSQVAENSLQSGYAKFKQQYKLYDTQVGQLEGEIKKTKTLLSKSTNLKTVNLFESEVESDKEAIQSSMESLDLLIKEYSLTKIRESYLAVFDNYNRIIKADFEYEYSLNTEQDLTNLTMKFYDNTNSDSSSAKAWKTRSLVIPTNGGLRINSSAGVGFLRFFNGNNSYSAENGLVNEVRGDEFTPQLVSMFHFYKQTHRPVSFGGSFGVGIPVEGVKDVIYNLGASLIVGQSQRVIFNVGIFGGKTNRLDGVSVGDTFALGGIVPTKRVFDYGTYFAVTFNLNSLF